MLAKTTSIIGKLVVETLYMSAVCSFFQSLSTLAFIFILLHFLYSIILCNFSSSHSPTGLQMLEPGPHSKTAGVPVSQLINTQNYLPASTPKPHFILFKHSHRKTGREKQFPIIALLNTHLLPFCNQNMGICARTKMSSKITRSTQKSTTQRIFRDSPLL